MAARLGAPVGDQPGPGLIRRIVPSVRDHCGDAVARMMFGLIPAAVLLGHVAAGSPVWLALASVLASAPATLLQNTARHRGGGAGLGVDVVGHHTGQGG